MSDKLTKGELRKAEIITLARTVLTSEGYEAFSLRDIAGRLNMKLGNLQYYFPNRESLLEAVIRAEANKDLELLVHELDQQLSPGDQVRCFCETIIDRWRGPGGRIFVLMSFLSYESETFKQIYEDVYENFYGALIPILVSLDPGHKPAIYQRRAMLITALIDGAPAQLARGQYAAFVKELSTHAYLIARGTQLPKESL